MHHIATLQAEGRTSRNPIGTGMISILMVLIVLLLTAFAVLSYTTAQAESKLTTKTLQAASDYYDADSRCEELLFQAETLASQSSSLSQLAEQLAELDGVTIDWDETGGCTADCILPVDDARQIRMVLRLTGKDGAAIEVVSRKVESTAEWDDGEIIVWEGN